MTYQVVDLPHEHVRSVPCIICNARAGEPCKFKNVIMLDHHDERVQLAAKLPQLPQELSATDKALIVYYAYIILCDSVAAKSTELIGKQFTTQQVQRFFAVKAIAELRKDGLLK